MTDKYVCITLDFDSISLWQAMGQTSPTPISRGEFGVVATKRLLQLFDRHHIKTTWYVPGITIATYPDAVRAIHDAGHEVGHHGYDHISPANLTPEAEADQLDRGIACIESATGFHPRGYRSPAWDLSANSVNLLLERGFVYDSSMMGHDTQPYRARTGDVVEAGKPMVFGQETDLWELPISWSADDFPHFEYFRGGGLRSTADVLHNWLEDYRYMAEQAEPGVMTYTLHPQVIGRGHRMRMLDRLLQSLHDEGAEFVTAEDAITRFSAVEAPQG